MDMSFALQARSLEWLLKNKGKLENKVYPVPREIDLAVAEFKVSSLGYAVDSLTDEQREYLEKVD